MSSNESTIEKEDNIDAFKALQKRFFKLGIIFLIVAMGLYVLLHSLAENPHIIIEFFIFAFAISSVISIFIGLVMTKDTNWFSLVGSTVFLFCFLLVLIFYPDQEFQKRLNTISLVAIIGTLLFGVFDVFINAVFFSSKNAEIRQSVDFVSNRFAVDVLTVTLIIGTLFGTIAYLFFVPNNNLSLFLSGIDIKTVALATAGLVTFFWAAKAAKNKSIELEEKKQDGKRRDKEIKMAEARDTAQLIAKASELLGSESDAQKNAGLSFLNTVASQKGGPLQKEAFDLLADFILSASDTTTANKPRMRAITYINNQIEFQLHEYDIEEYVTISGSSKNSEELEKGNTSYLFRELHIIYKNFCFTPINCILNKGEFSYDQLLYDHCIFYFFDRKYQKDEFEITLVSDCLFINCNINNIMFYNFPKGMKKKWDKEIPVSGNSCCFVRCNFSFCSTWKFFRFFSPEVPKSEKFLDCYFFSGQPPLEYDWELDRNLLKQISSETEIPRAFQELIWTNGRVKFKKNQRK